MRRIDALAQLVGVTGIAIGHGLRDSGLVSAEFGGLVMLSMAVITLGIFLRFRWSLARQSFARRHWTTVGAGATWLFGLIVVIIVGPLLSDPNGPEIGGRRFWGLIYWSELVLGTYAISGAVRGVRKFASGGLQPALLLVFSFLFLISVGTAMLMLPVSRLDSYDEPGRHAPFHIALFTATSASCVTGLVVVDTPTYWSHFGQMVILVLFQIGGLGIMSFGAFFAVIAGRNVRLNEFKTMRELFSSGTVGSLRQLVLAVLGFTLASELIGTILLMPYWSDLPFPERLWMSTFHSVSAFCNAGFALTENSFVGSGSSWHVSGVLAGLIIVGGLGFSVLFNLFHYGLAHVRGRFRNPFVAATPHRIRLRVDTKMILITTFALLVGGCGLIFLLERTGTGEGAAISLSDAWFQSVTFRTAGFNTVDLGSLQPSTKLVAILLMLIGASPGSTGGGVKTTVFAVCILGVESVLRGRNKVEAFGRSLSETTVNRALAILFVSVVTVMTTTILLVIFEQRPELFLDHLFEATSAVGTVGVSTTVANVEGGWISTTQSLSLPSQMVIVVAMFLGRIGPLTLLLALAGNPQTVRYEFPAEAVTLG